MSKINLNLVSQALEQIKQNNSLSMEAKKTVFAEFEKYFEVPELMPKSFTVDDLKAKLNDAGLVKNTLGVYLNGFNNIFKKVFNSVMPTPTELLDANKIMNYLNGENIKPTVKKTTLNAYINCLKIMGLDTSSLNVKFSELAKTIDENRQYRKPTEKELANEITMNDVITKRDQLKGQSKHLRDYVVLCLYSYLPPMRGESFLNSLLVENSDNEELKDKNYLCLTKKVLVLNSYKTVKTHGQSIVQIPDELIDVLKQYKAIGAQYVISGKDKGKMDQTALVKVFHKIFNKKVSVSVLRKIYVSEMANENASADKRKVAAKIMGHTLATQQLIYTTYSDIVKE